MLSKKTLTKCHCRGLGGGANFVLYGSNVVRTDFKTVHCYDKSTALPEYQTKAVADHILKAEAFFAMGSFILSPRLHGMMIK